MGQQVKQKARQIANLCQARPRTAFVSADTDVIGGIAAVRVGLAPTLVDREGRPYLSLYNRPLALSQRHTSQAAVARQMVRRSVSRTNANAIAVTHKPSSINAKCKAQGVRALVRRRVEFLFSLRHHCSLWMS
jgi:hypothetical protein